MSVGICMFKCNIRDHICRVLVWQFVDTMIYRVDIKNIYGSVCDKSFFFSLIVMKLFSLLRCFFVVVGLWFVCQTFFVYGLGYEELSVWFGVGKDVLWGGVVVGIFLFGTSSEFRVPRFRDWFLRYRWLLLVFILLVGWTVFLWVYYDYELMDWIVGVKYDWYYLGIVLSGTFVGGMMKWVPSSEFRVPNFFYGYGGLLLVLLLLVCCGSLGSFCGLIFFFRLWVMGLWGFFSWECTSFILFDVTWVTCEAFVTFCVTKCFWVFLGGFFGFFCLWTKMFQDVLAGVGDCFV